MERVTISVAGDTISVDKDPVNIVAGESIEFVGPSRIRLELRFHPRALEGRENNKWYELSGGRLQARVKEEREIKYDIRANESTTLDPRIIVRPPNVQSLIDRIRDAPQPYGLVLLSGLIVGWLARAFFW